MAIIATDIVTGAAPTDYLLGLLLAFAIGAVMFVLVFFLGVGHVRNSPRDGWLVEAAVIDGSLTRARRWFVSGRRNEAAGTLSDLADAIRSGRPLE